MADKAPAEMENLLSTDAQEQPPLFELRPVGGKGSGLFATTNIACGTRIIAEAPLIAMPHTEDVMMRFTHLVAALNGATPDQRKAYFDLYHTPIVGPTPEDLELVAEEGKIMRNGLLIASAILNTNSAQMGSNSEYGIGVFASYSRMNHSCTPNTHASYNPTLEKLTVHATCRIYKDQEISTTYINLRQICEKRNADLSNWGFRCLCKCCSGPKLADSDSRRERIFEAEQKLAACYEGKESDAELSVPNSPQEALEVAKELLDTLRLESLADLRYAGAYRMCSMYSLACDNFRDAIRYAKDSLKIERYCIGTETAHFRVEQGFEGAEHWLQHVKDEHAKVHGKPRAEKEVRKAEAAILAKSAEMDVWYNDELAGKEKDKDKTKSSNTSVVAPHGVLTEVSELSVEDGSMAQSLDSGRHDANASSISAVVNQCILDQSSDLTSTPLGQRAPSSESRPEQAADVDFDHLDQEGVELEYDVDSEEDIDWEEDFDDDEDVDEDEYVDKDEDVDLEDDAQFAMASFARRGAKHA